MKILLHICCAPCAIYPLKRLRDSGHEVTGFFYNHNIHPYQEYRRRLDTLLDFADRSDLELVVRDQYLIEEFLAAVSKKPEERCSYCYSSRLDILALTAADNGFEMFTSSLLYSRYQKHDGIVQYSRLLENRHGVAFYYEDFRTGWQEGIRISKEMNLYRQQYCGCIYSEKERYWKSDSIFGKILSKDSLFKSEKQC